MEPTQISLGGFGVGVTAKQLTEYLEENVGMVWRCRLKTSWTPPFAYPKFTISSNYLFENRDVVPPHAFVHFAVPDAVKEAVKLASHGKLVFNNQALKIKVGSETSFRVVKRRTMPPHRFSPVTIEIGSLYNLDKFLVAWKGPTSGVDFHVDPFDKRCRIIFTRDQLFGFQNLNEDTLIKCDFKIEFLIRDIRNVRFLNEMGKLVMLIQLWVPPCIYYRTADDDVHVAVPFALLDDDDPWIRTLDFTPNNAIGRCLVYKITHSPRLGHTMEKAKEYFKQNRLLDETISKVSSLKSWNEPVVPRPRFFLVLQQHPEIPFDTMFLLTALVHKGIVNYHRLTPELYNLLKSKVTPTKLSTIALRQMLSYTYPIFDAFERLETLPRWIRKNPKLLKNPKIVEETIEVRRLIITPTKAYCLPPEVELSNRVIRQFKDYADRFLRVTFMDDSMENMSSTALIVPIAPIVKEVSSSSPAHRTAIFRQVRQILLDGFELCGRRYLFLAFSANQLRGRSAWFFAGNRYIDVHQIKRWMGTFPEYYVAKHAARMGQCFSATYCTIQVPRNQLEKDFLEIERGGYKFSDGIGKITPDLAMEVAQKLQLTINPPSAYQIRYGGYKGVVATWEAEPGSKHKLSLRPSMEKFKSPHDMLEVITWTRFQPCFLNRQIITLLSTLRVPDSVFSELQDSMVHKLSQMIENDEVAFHILATSCTGDLQYTAAMMLSAGFKPQTEPHLKDMLSSIRSVQLEELLRKCRIFVPDGRWLMGCLDEIGTLEYGQCFIKISSPPLEGCVLKNGSSFLENKTSPRVIKGKVIVAKNPCLHPGDIRILEAVDAPCLHHLVDCLIFPQKGHRPHPDEASGSDLDGDIYFVSWDTRLIPESGESWEPMCYSAGEAKRSKAPVTRVDVIEFFVQHMVNDSVGVICNAHVVRADLSDCGALEEDCLKLAKLAAEAVDFPKTGKAPVMPQYLRPRQYPDFMDKVDLVSYRSEKILGTLYRKVLDMFGEEFDEQKCCIDITNASETLPYDNDLEVSGFEEYIEEAWQYKCSYDRQLQALLGQFNIRKEGEIVTGKISSLSKYNSRRQDEIKKRLHHAYRALRKEFRLIFEGTINSQNLEPCEQFKYKAKASAWYHVTYHSTWVQKTAEHLTEPGYCPSAPLLSFAWITVDYLAQIKLQKLWPNVDYSSAIRSILPPFRLVTHK
ncbi:RNA-dependent RNA polymerase 6 [Cryptomeria japonica]|uniref:RNA-dependent RNA polymerase 6 n=1 Tax=Cryptomeria japonica TaxID=3369 RepID=UPI0027DA6B1E|nr:RNA-dependent RNA polymerase 6 [Cryptomeria japonica]